MEYDPASDLYLVLGVAVTATEGEITKAHRERIKAVHPDRAGGDTVRAAELNNARDVLLDSGLRAAYDEARTAWWAAFNRQMAAPASDLTPESASSALAQYAPVTLTPLAPEIAFAKFLTKMRKPQWKSLAWWLETIAYGVVVTNGLQPEATRTPKRGARTSRRAPGARAAARRKRSTPRRARR